MFAPKNGFINSVTNIEFRHDLLLLNYALPKQGIQQVYINLSSHAALAYFSFTPQHVGMKEHLTPSLSSHITGIGVLGGWPCAFTWRDSPRSCVSSNCSDS